MGQPRWVLVRSCCRSYPSSSTDKGRQWCWRSPGVGVASSHWDHRGSCPAGGETTWRGLSGRKHGETRPLQENCLGKAGEKITVFLPSHHPTSALASSWSNLNGNEWQGSPSIVVYWDWSLSFSTEQGQARMVLRAKCWGVGKWGPLWVWTEGETLLTRESG